MKISKLFFIAVIKICFVLFGIIPLVNVILFGTLPTFTAIQSVTSWVGIDVVLGFVLFLSYLVVAIALSMSKNRTRYSSMKTFA